MPGERCVPGKHSASPRDQTAWSLVQGVRPRTAEKPPCAGAQNYAVPLRKNTEWRLLRLDQPAADGRPEQLGGRLRTEGVHQLVLVRLDRSRREVELGRDLLDAQAIGKQAEHL